MNLLRILRPSTQVAQRALRRPLRRLRPGRGPHRRRSRPLHGEEDRRARGCPGPGDRSTPARASSSSRSSRPSIVKKELDILWHDYFKPEHLEKYPNLHDVFWKAAKAGLEEQARSQDPANGEALLKAVEEIHNIFWATKNRTDVPFYRANP
nr:superoxide dismutase [Ni] [Tepidiforma sp.]